MQIINLKTGHFFQKLTGDEFRNKDDHVSFIDQDLLVLLFGLHSIKEEAFVVHKDDHTSIEDEEKSTTSLQSSYNPSQMEANEGIQFEDLTQNIRVLYSEYEVVFILLLFVMFD